MKKFILGLVAGLLLAMSATALAASRSGSTSRPATNLITIRNGDEFVTSNRVLLCVMVSGTILCGKQGRPHGYTIGISSTLIAVSLGNRFVFKRKPVG